MTLKLKQGLCLAAVFLILISAAASIDPINLTSAYTPWVPHYSNIFIYENGTILPRTAAIQNTGNRYILTNDVYGNIAVQKSDIVIDGNGHKMYGYQGTGILLQNVTGVTLQNLHFMYFSYGIYLENVNGSILKNNTLVNCGIELVQANNILLSGNNASKLISVEFSNGTSVIDNVAGGVSVTWSSNVTVGNNRLADAKMGNLTSTSGVYTEGISIDNSDNCNVYGNTIERKGLGVNIWYSTNLTFTNNILNDNQFGFKLLGGNLQNYLHTIDATNTVNGKPVSFLVNMTNYQVPRTAGWIAAINCSGITIQDWTSTPNWDGILFAYTSDSKISNSNLKNNFNALKLVNASNCEITKNTLISSQYAALYFEDASSSTITQNNVIENLCFFYLWGNSTGNTFVQNNFVGNFTGSINRNLNTRWNNNKEGNYWSCFTGVDLDHDGASEVPVLIDIYSGERDLHPHMTPYDNGVPIATPAQSTGVRLAMPYETINYTITTIDDALWAKIDGHYPMHLTSTDAQPLSLVYPIPPNTTNIQIKLDGTEVNFDYYSNGDEESRHYTDIGYWQMISCKVNPASADFLLEIHYEHPIEIRNGSYTFLYDLNIGPYLSASSINSVAHFNVRLEGERNNLQAFTTGYTGKWTPIGYNNSTEGTATAVTFEIVSKYGEPLLGDIAFILSDSVIPELSTWAIMLALASATAATIIANRKQKHQKR